ncbi:MAG: Lrp/AsnC ligand binding domain-containing protein, partial [Nitrososphaeraceae archaeon]|nr:Lrp/AsnC ligand binding domain-containing protein [Nitrososphaeraceae archaeon]
YEIANNLKKIENVVNVDIVNGAYDLILEALFETMEDMRERFQNEIRQIDRLMSTLTLVASEST